MKINKSNLEHHKSAIKQKSSNSNSKKDKENKKDSIKMKNISNEKTNKIENKQKMMELTLSLNSNKENKREKNDNQLKKSKKEESLKRKSTNNSFKNKSENNSIKGDEKNNKKFKDNDKIVRGFPKNTSSISHLINSGSKNEDIYWTTNLRQPNEELNINKFEGEPSFFYKDNEEYLAKVKKYRKLYDISDTIVQNNSGIEHMFKRNCLNPSLLRFELSLKSNSIVVSDKKQIKRRKLKKEDSNSNISNMENDNEKENRNEFIKNTTFLMSSKNKLTNKPDFLSVMPPPELSFTKNQMKKINYPKIYVVENKTVDFNNEKIRSKKYIQSDFGRLNLGCYNEKYNDRFDFNKTSFMMKSNYNYDMNFSNEVNLLSKMKWIEELRKLKKLKTHVKSKKKIRETAVV